MGPEIRCNCGWRSQVSEFYLGDRVTCPECGTRVNVHEQQSVPYGYAPYPTWQKRIEPSVRVPRRRKVQWRPKDDPFATPAFWLGLGALFFSLVGCGVLPGILMAIFAMRAAIDSRKFCEMHRLYRQLRAKLGFIMGGVAIVMVLFSAFDAFDGHHCRHHRTCTINESPERPRVQDDSDYAQQQQQVIDYYRGDGVQQEYEPRSDFERHQIEYSERVRNERTRQKFELPQLPEPEAPTPPEVQPAMGD